MLDGAYTIANLGIIGKLGKIGKRLGMVTVIGADALIQKGCQLWVGIAQPSTVRHTVGNVVEFFGVELVEILKRGFLENVGVQLGYTVD